MGRPCKCCGNCPCIKYAHRYLIDSDPSSEWISLDGSTTIDWQNEDLGFGGSGSILISSEDTNSLNYSFISRDSFCNGVDLFWEFDYYYQIRPGDYYNVRIGTTDGTDGLLLTFKKIQPTSNTCEPEGDDFFGSLEDPGQDLIQATIEFNGEILYSETLVEFVDGSFSVDTLNLYGKVLYNFSDDASKIFPQGCAPDTWITTFANLCYRNDISTLIFNNYFIEDIVLPGDKISFEFVFQQPGQVVGFRDLMFRDVEGSKSLISPFLSDFSPWKLGIGSVNICTSQCIECEACWERVWSYSETGKHQFCDEKRFDTEYSTSETSATIISTEAHPWFGSNYDPPWASFCSIGYAGVGRNFEKEGYARLYLNTNSPNSGTFTGMEIKQLDEPIGVCTHGVYFQYGKDNSVNYEQLVYYFPTLTNPTTGVSYFPIYGFYFQIIQTYDGKIRFYSEIFSHNTLPLLLSYDLATGDEKWYHEINENTSGAFVSATIQGLFDPLISQQSYHINPWEEQNWTVTHKMLHPDGSDTDSEQWGTSSKSLLQGACESNDIPPSIYYNEDEVDNIPMNLQDCTPVPVPFCSTCSSEENFNLLGVSIGGDVFICEKNLDVSGAGICRYDYIGESNCGVTTAPDPDCEPRVVANSTVNFWSEPIMEIYVIIDSTGNNVSWKVDARLFHWKKLKSRDDLTCNDAKWRYPSPFDPTGEFFCESNYNGRCTDNCIDINQFSFIFEGSGNKTFPCSDNFPTSLELEYSTAESLSIVQVLANDLNPLYLQASDNQVIFQANPYGPDPPRNTLGIDALQQLGFQEVNQQDFVGGQNPEYYIEFIEIDPFLAPTEVLRWDQFGIFGDQLLELRQQVASTLSYEEASSQLYGPGVSNGTEPTGAVVFRQTDPLVPFEDYWQCVLDPDYQSTECQLYDDLRDKNITIFSI